MCGNLNNLGRVYTDTKHELFVEDGNKLIVRCLWCLSFAICTCLTQQLTFG